MAVEFKLPELGENIDSAEVVRVLVSVGDIVKKEQPVIEVETDKAAVEVPAPVSGRVTEVLVKEGETINVGQLVLTIEPNGEVGEAEAEAKEEKKVEKEPAVEKKETAPIEEVVRAPEAEKRLTEPEAAAAEAEPAAEERPVLAAPSVRQFAREIGVDIHQVPGTGAGGRISIEDVKRYARGLLREPRPAPGAAAVSAPPLPEFSKWGPVERAKMSSVRRKTMQHMNLSWQTIPHVTLHNKADITAVEKIRQRYKQRAEAEGGTLTITAILMKVVAAALKVHPKVNASIDASSEEIIFKQYVHIGVAADTERGLVVPVVRNVDQKNIIELAVELTQLAEKARAGKLTLEEMQGASFTITNLGGIGVGFFTPIINYPDVAILGVGRAARELVEIGGEFQPRLMLPLSLSIDHRLVDGADGARFLKWIIDALEEPMLLAMEG